MQVPKRKPGKYAGIKPDRLITEEKLISLRSALSQIMENDLPQASKDVSVAKEMGDFSENAAYTEAKSRLRRFQNRAMSIKDSIANAVIIKKGAAADGSVRVGATVTVLVNGKEKNYEILGSQETDPGSGRISYLSPLGVLLMGKRAGDTIILKRDDREIPYEIINVK